MALPTPENTPEGIDGGAFARAINNGRLDDYGAFTIKTAANGDIPLVNYMPRACKVVKTVTDTVEGSCTVTFKNGSTPLGGTPNSASATRQEQDHSTDNDFAVGDRLRATISAASGCKMLALTVIYLYPTSEPEAP